VLENIASHSLSTVTQFEKINQMISKLLAISGHKLFCDEACFRLRQNSSDVHRLNLL